AGFDDRESIDGIDGEDRLEPVQPDDDRVVRGERAGGEAGTRAARNEGTAFTGEETDHGQQGVTRFGKDGEPGRAVVGRQSVRAVGKQLARPVEQGARAHDLAEGSGERVGHEGEGAGSGDELSGDACNVHSGKRDPSRAEWMRTDA